MPKVVHLTPYYWPHVGGVETHLQRIGPALSKMGYSQALITLQHADNLPLKENHDSFTICRVTPDKGTSKTLHKLKLWLGLFQHRQLLVDADIIHVHDVFWWLIPFFPFLRRQKIFMTFHGYEGNTLPKWNHIFWKRVAEKLTVGSLAIGEFQKRWFGLHPTFISYGGVTALKAERKTNNQRELKGIFLGRLEPDNGLMVYLEAIRLLMSNGQRVKLDVYGDGAERKKAEAYAKKHKLTVNFYGFVEGVATKLRDYDFACVSRYLSIIEALAAGTPVISFYANDLQADYLRLAPFAEWITISATPAEMVDTIGSITPLKREAITWAQQQTWEKVAHTYHQLWQRQRL